MSTINQNMVDLGAGLSIWVSPGVLTYIPACKISATDSHTSGCSEIDKPQAVVVPSRVEAFSTNHGAEEVLLPDLRICIPDDDFDVVSWALILRFFRSS